MFPEYSTYVRRADGDSACRHGQLAGDPAPLSGTVGHVDLGHHTVDEAVIRRLAPVLSSLDPRAELVFTVVLL